MTAECQTASALQRSVASQKVARPALTVCWYSRGCSAITFAGRSCRKAQKGALSIYWHREKETSTSRHVL